jgi:hypothetical protein
VVKRSAQKLLGTARFLKHARLFYRRAQRALLSKPIAALARRAESLSKGFTFEKT